jgi:hypothetical protein
MKICRTIHSILLS